MQLAMPFVIHLLPVPPEARPQDGQRGAHLQRVQHQVRQRLHYHEVQLQQRTSGSACCTTARRASRRKWHPGRAWGLAVKRPPTYAFSRGMRSRRPRPSM